MYLLRIEQKIKTGISESSLDVFIPSFPASPRSLSFGSSVSSEIIVDDPALLKAVDYLHADNDLLVAAETGNVTVLEVLLR